MVGDISPWNPHETYPHETKTPLRRSLWSLLLTGQEAHVQRRLPGFRHIIWQANDLLDLQHWCQGRQGTALDAEPGTFKGSNRDRGDLPDLAIYPYTYIIYIYIY